MTLPKSKAEYVASLTKPWKFWLSMVINLPSIAFWGAKVVSIDDNQCVVSLPFRWSSKNPFKSIYFSALNGAAEISTGFLVQMMVAEYGPHSMLVTKFEVEFVKKADTTILFTCDQGNELVSFFDGLKSKGESGVIALKSEGRNTRNEVVCRMIVTWSIKRKN